MALSTFYGKPQPNRAQNLAPLLKRYTSAELAWAVRELVYCPDVGDKKRYRSDLDASDFERVLKKRASLLHKVKMRLTERERDALILEWPRELSLLDFGCCGYNSFNEPVFMFTRQPQTRYVEPARFEVIQ